MAEINGVSATEVATIKAEVDGLRREVAGISAQIGQLATTINDRSRTPWGTLISAMGVLLVIVGYGGNLALAPVVQKLLDHDVAFMSLREGIVPRGEHERVWANADARAAELARRIDELRQDVSGLYGAKDFFQDVQARLDRLEQRDPNQ